jgi:hypothetical protein
MVLSPSLLLSWPASAATTSWRTAAARAAHEGRGGRRDGLPERPRARGAAGRAAPRGEEGRGRARRDRAPAVGDRAAAAPRRGRGARRRPAADRLRHRCAAAKILFLAAQSARSRRGAPRGGGPLLRARRGGAARKGGGGLAKAAAPPNHFRRDGGRADRPRRERGTLGFRGRAPHCARRARLARLEGGLLARRARLRGRGRRGRRALGAGAPCTRRLSGREGAHRGFRRERGRARERGGRVGFRARLGRVPPRRARRRARRHVAPPARARRERRDGRRERRRGGRRARRRRGDRTRGDRGGEDGRSGRGRGQKGHGRAVAARAPLPARAARGAFSVIAAGELERRRARCLRVVIVIKLRRSVALRACRGGGARGDGCISPFPSGRPTLLIRISRSGGCVRARSRSCCRIVTRRRLLSVGCRLSLKVPLRRGVACEADAEAGTARAAAALALCVRRRAPRARNDHASGRLALTRGRARGRPHHCRRAAARLFGARRLRRLRRREDEDERGRGRGRRPAALPQAAPDAHLCDDDGAAREGESGGGSTAELRGRRAPEAGGEGGGTPRGGEG